MIRLRLDKKLRPRQWSAVLIACDTENKSVDLYVQTACDSVIGKWSLRVLTSCKSVQPISNGIDSIMPDRIFDYLHDKSVYVLFNPWSKGEFIYLIE